VGGSGRGLILSGTLALDDGQMKTMKNFRTFRIKTNHLTGHLLNRSLELY
jgi:hypothetical protein